MRLLIVDDNGLFRRALRRMLEADGYAVDEAEGVRTALELVATAPYEVALVDVNLGDGVVVEDFAALVSIVVIAMTGDVDWKPARASRISATLYKPFDRAQLATAIGRRHLPV